MPRSMLRLSVATAALLLALACGGNPKPQTPPPAAPATAEQEAPGEYGREVAEAVPEPPAEEPGAVELQPGDEVNGEVPDEEATAADPETLLHESMEAYQSAEEFWEQGAFDDAFAALDHAYERMLAVVPPEGDPILAQEKENLRNLISRRIVEIYASRQTAVGDPDKSIPRDMNDDVRREIASFRGPERDFFVESYRRSGYYRPMIVAQLAEAGMPEQLSWLPLVESGFKDRALSSARALGLWQFIPSTGYRYGLDRNDWVDERMDPEKATAGAIAYLTALHNLFGDWLTALAAYNCGERNVLRQIQNQKVSYFDQFWDPYQLLPRETRRYVPRFLATLEILDDPKKYGFDLPEPYPALRFETVQIVRATQLDAIDKALALPAGTMLRLNPELRRNGSPSTAYTLRVPAGTGQTFLASLDTLPKWSPPRESGGSHRVRSGETLSGIAARYRTSVRALMAANRLRSADRLSVGQVLQLPGGASAPSTPSSSRAITALAPGTEVQHRVRSGDSLWLLAARYGTTVERIRSDNGLRTNFLKPGQVLTIRASGSARGGA